jgi:hypothetical protein
VLSSAPAGGALGCPLLSTCFASAAHASSPHPRHSSSLPAPCLLHRDGVRADEEALPNGIFRVRSEKTWRRGKWGPKPLKMAREPYQTDPNLGCREAKFISVPQWAPPITPCLRLDQIKLCRSTTPTPHF